MAVVSTDTNLSAVSYVAGETITIQGGATLTMDATPAVRPGIIQCIRSGKFSIVNPSTTTPIKLELNSYTSDLRFEGNGVFETRGNMIEIWESDGTYKSWDFTSLFSGLLTDVTLVEVETSAGSGEYKPWRIAEITPALYAPIRYSLQQSYLVHGGASKTMFDANQEVLFWDADTKILDTGDGTNGKLIPTGCKVRIPNILVTTQYHYSDQSAVRHYLITYGPPTAGTFTITINNKYTSTTLGTTAPIAYNATAATVDAAIEAVLGAGTVTVTSGPLPAAIVITQAGAYATTPLQFVVNSSVTGGTSPLACTLGYNAPDLALLDLNASGSFDGECVAFSRVMYVINSAFSLFRAIHCGFGGPNFGLTNANGSIELDHVSYSNIAYYGSAVNQISNIAGACSFNKYVTSTPFYNGTYFGTLPNLTRLDDCESHCWGTYNSSSAYCFYITQIYNIDILRPVATGGRFYLISCSGVNMIEPKQGDSSGTVQRTTPALSVVTITNAIDCVIFNLTKIGTAAARNTAFVADAACSNVQIIGGSYDGSGNTPGVVVPGGDVLNVTNFDFTNGRTGPFVDLPTAFTSKRTYLSKLFMTQSVNADALIDSGQDNIYDLVSCTILGFNPANSAVENFVGGNFTEQSLTPTTGHVTFGAFGRGTSMVMTGGTYTDQIGSIYMPTNGDTAVVTMPFSMHGITSFQNVEPRWIAETIGGKARQWRIINDGGVTGGTFTISVYGPSGTLIGTTTALAYNASATAIDTALGVVTGSAGNHTVSGNLLSGWIVTFTTTYGIVTLTVDGSLLTGGTKPGTAEAHAIPARLAGEELGSNLTAEYAVKTPTGSWTAYKTVSGANLSAELALLPDYDEADGLDMRLKFTATGDDDYRRVQVVTMPTNLDVTTYSPPDSSITLHGVNPTDIVRIYDTDNTLLYTFTGGGLQRFAIGSNLGASVYIVRKNSVGVEIMRTQTSPFTLNFGDNGEFDLYSGAEVQVADGEYIPGQVWQYANRSLTSSNVDFPKYLSLGDISIPLAGGNDLLETEDGNNIGV